MYTYRSPHTMRAIQEAFEKGDEDLGYKLMHENQLAMDRRASFGGQFYWTANQTVAEGAEVAVDFAVVGGVWNMVRTLLTPTDFSQYPPTGGTYSFNPAPDEGFLATNSLAVTQGVHNFVKWDVSQTVQFRLESGWTRPSGSGNLEFQHYVITSGLSQASEN